MIKKLLTLALSLILMSPVIAHAATQGSTTGKGNWDLSAATLELPNTTTCAPTDCDVSGEAGRTCVDTDATTQQQFYICEGVSGWKLQSPPTGAKYITQTADGTLTGEQALSVLSTGLLKNTTGTGVLSIATAGTDYLVTEADPVVKAINGLVKSNGSTISVALAGTDYVVPGGNVATATALATNGSNCASGEYATGVSASGVAEGCTVDTGASRNSTPLTWNVVPAACIGDGNAGTLTVNGSNQIVCDTDDGGIGGGTGDITSVGDCIAGSCMEGTNGTYIRLYDGNSNYTQLISSNISATTTITLPATSGTLLVSGDNVATATALAANGSNCSAGSAPLGVDASGAVETCTDYEEDLSNSAGLRAALSDESGTGAAIFAGGALGVATATSINKVALTAPATSATITVADGKTLTVNRTMTLTSAGESGVLTLPNTTDTLIGLLSSPSLTGAWNFSGGSLRLPSSASLPATCTTGQSYVDTTGSSGRKFYVCESTNAWILQGSTDLTTDVAWTIGDNASGDIILTFSGDANTDGTLTWDVSEDAFSISNTLKLYSDAAPAGINTVGDIAYDTNLYGAGRGAIMTFDGTGQTAVVGITTSDLPCNNGDVVKFNTGGTWTCEPDDNSGGITSTDTCVLFSDGANNPSCDTADFNYNKTSNTLYVDALVLAPSATPTSAQYDSDTTDGDINTQTVTDCTATGSNVEYCDYTISQQINGSMTGAITLNADGKIMLARDSEITSGNLNLEDGVFFVKEQTAGDADVLTYGQVWVKDDAPNTLWFTNDLGTDFQLGTSAATAYHAIGDPTAAGSLTFDDGETATYDGANEDETFFTISLNKADLTADTEALLITAVDNDDANYIPLLIQDDQDVTPDDLFKVDYAGAVTAASSIISGGDVTLAESIYATEQAAPGGDTGGNGQIWVKNDTPNTLWFTDDASTDKRLGNYIDSKNVYWTEPTSADDFKSILCNDTGETWTFTKISCESDQTVNMDVQVDDGSPADVIGSDLACDATPADACAAGCDTTIAGDSELADGECLDFAVTSVASAPTWNRITFTIRR